MAQLSSTMCKPPVPRTVPFNCSVTGKAVLEQFHRGAVERQEEVRLRGTHVVLNTSPITVVPRVADEIPSRLDRPVVLDVVALISVCVGAVVTDHRLDRAFCRDQLEDRTMEGAADIDNRSALRPCGSPSLVEGGTSALVLLSPACFERKPFSSIDFGGSGEAASISTCRSAGIVGASINIEVRPVLFP